MFAIFYCIVSLFEQMIHGIHSTSHDVKASIKAVDEGDVGYTDFYGRTRLTLTNEQAMFHIDPLTGESGYRIIEPGENYHTFVSNYGSQKDAEWERAHRLFLAGKWDKEETVIPYESAASIRDDPHAYYYDEKRGSVHPVPRMCRGRRVRDIETGRTFVERYLCYEKRKIRVYMDIETGMAIRPSDYQMRLHRIAPTLDTMEWMEKKIQIYNNTKRQWKERGFQESNPDMFYDNFSIPQGG